MPKVGSKNFSYTKEGYKAARDYAKSKGKKVRHDVRKVAAQRMLGKMKSE